MDAVALRLRDEDTPPPSGIRIRVLASARAADELERDVLPEVAEEVMRGVWQLVHALSPLPGAWFRTGLRPLGSTALIALGWHTESARLSGPNGSSQAAIEVLRARWPELVPGYASMRCLVGLMADALCRRQPRRRRRRP
jgi:hypothetical protein